MTGIPMQDEPRIARMIVMAERLTEAMESDIAALKNGQPGALKTGHPEIQKLSALYGKDAEGFDPRIAQAAPEPLRARFISVTGRFRDVLQLHGRMLTRVKNASEGMIRAIAQEVERTSAPIRTYGPRPGQQTPMPGALVVNRVV